MNISPHFFKVKKSEILGVSLLILFTFLIIYLQYYYSKVDNFLMLVKVKEIEQKILISL